MRMIWETGCLSIFWITSVRVRNWSDPTESDLGKYSAQYMNQKTIGVNSLTEFKNKS